MDMEAGIEQLGRATAQGVDVMIVVLEPGKRSVDCAKTVMRMTKDIGIKRLLFVGNKITCSEDEDFLKTALPECEFAAMIPYSEEIRKADRDGMAVLDCLSKPLKEKYAKILEIIEN